MERQQRFASRVSPDLDVAEREAPPAQAQRFHGRFLCGEASGDVLGEGAGMAPLLRISPRAKHPLEKAFAVPLEDAGHAVDLRQVEAEQQADTIRHSRPFRPKKRAIWARSDSGLGRGRTAGTVEPIGRLAPALLDDRIELLDE